MRSTKDPRTGKSRVVALGVAASLALLAIAAVHALFRARPVSGPDSTPETVLTDSETAIATLPPDNDGSGTISTSSDAVGSNPIFLSPKLRDLAEHDPLAAAAHLSDLPMPLRTELAAVIASAWGKREPELAAAWARDQLEGEARTEALLSLSADWASVAPSAAADCGLTLIPENRQSEFLKTIGMQWGRQDVTSALAWAERLPEGNPRDSFLAGLCSTLAETAPSQAARLVSALGSAQLTQEAALTVVLEWGRQDPQAAADWVKLFPTGRLREKALWNLASLWAEQSSAPAPPVLLDWPIGPERDQAIRHFLDAVLETEPARGVQLLSAITDDDLRQEETERLAQHWGMHSNLTALGLGQGP